MQLISLTTGELLERIDAHDLTITAMRWCDQTRTIASYGFL